MPTAPEALGGGPLYRRLILSMFPVAQIGDERIIRIYVFFSPWLDVFDVAYGRPTTVTPGLGEALSGVLSTSSRFRRLGLLERMPVT